MGESKHRVDRREFLAAGGAAVVAGATAGRPELQSPATPGLLAAPPRQTVRIGFVGIGLQGSGHVNNLLKIDGCRITAVIANRSLGR